MDISIVIVEPSDKAVIFEKISKSEVPIKQILLNQKLIAGIGNIYASEILFDCKISPLILGKDLNISLIMKLIKSTRKILKKAIKYGGSSIRDYRSTDGTLGSFQSNFKFNGGSPPDFSTTAGQVDRVDYIIKASGTIHCAVSINVS